MTWGSRPFDAAHASQCGRNLRAPDARVNDGYDPA